MDDFYTEFLEEVSSFMDKKQYKEALILLEDEFVMPYIPKEAEEKMIAMYNECKHELNALKKDRKYTEDDIEELLSGGIDEACQAVELLKKANIRNYIDVIENYLKDRPHYLIRTLLVEALIEQQVNDEIQMNYDGLDVSFIPVYALLPQDQDVFVEAVKQIKEYYENENPTFMMMCIESMMKEMYFRMPFPLSEDEKDSFVYAILEYVYKACDELEAFQAFIHEKNLANLNGFDLLLYKYDI